MKPGSPKKMDQTTCLFGPWQETCGVWSKRSIFQGCCPPENFEWVFMMALPPFPLVPPFHLPVTGYLFLPILFHRSPTLRCSPLVPNGPLHAAAKHHVQSGNDPINPRFQPKAPKQRSNPPTGLNKTGSRRRIPWNAGCLMGFWCYGLWNNLRITVVGHPLYTTNKATIGFFSLLRTLESLVRPPWWSHQKTEQRLKRDTQPQPSQKTLWKSWIPMSKSIISVRRKRGHQ